jgi:hypothetical protein
LGDRRCIFILFSERIENSRFDGSVENLAMPSTEDELKHLILRIHHRAAPRHSAYADTSPICPPGKNEDLSCLALCLVINKKLLDHRFPIEVAEISVEKISHFFRPEGYPFRIEF